MPAMPPTLAQLDLLPTDSDGFRLRGTAMTRIETFTDAAFAFAVTMLVISIEEVPTSYGELLDLLALTPIFALSFAQLFAFWGGHHIWSRRFGLDDGMTLFLSAILVFVTLVFVFPLRFVVTVFCGFILSQFPGQSYPMHLAGIAGGHQLHDMFAIYGAGFCSLSLVLVLMNAYALRRKADLGLNAREIELTRGSRRAWLIYATIGALSTIVAFVVPPVLAGIPGYIYCLLAIAMPVHYARLNRRLKALEAA